MSGFFFGNSYLSEVDEAIWHRPHEGHLGTTWEVVLAVVFGGLLLSLILFRDVPSD